MSLAWLNHGAGLPLRLHLGCGDFALPHAQGWVNIDQRMQPGVDRVDNIGLLRRFSAGCVDVIYCSHALDHFTRWEYPRALERWFALLKPGGELWLSTIDFAVVADLYLHAKVPMRQLTGALAAGQDYPSNVRHVHFDEWMLTDALLCVGFTKVTRTSRTDGYFFAGDCSAAKINDRLISLNMIAVK